MNRFFLITLGILLCHVTSKASDLPTISIVYNGATVSVDIPAEVTGVTSTISGADVTLFSTNVTNEYCYKVCGSSTNGSLLIIGSYKLTLELAGISLTSEKGAAIDIETDKRVAVILLDGTVNTLKDKQGGEQKAVLYFSGHPEFEGVGTLNVTGRTKHAIAANEYLQLKKSTGTINILSAVTDGIHCGKGKKLGSDNNRFIMNGGVVNISNVGGDCIDSDSLGVVNINGGELNYTVSADGGRGIKCYSDFTMTGGTINAKLEGGILVEDDDTDRCMAINVGGNMNISGGNINIHKANNDARSFKVKGNLTITENGQISETGNYFDVNPKDYKYDMTVYAKLTIDGTAPSDYTNYQIGAFADNICCGTAEINSIANNSSYAYIRIYSNTPNEKITFKVFDSSSGVIYTTAESVTFSSDNTTGTPSVPKNLSITTISPGDLNADKSITIEDLALLVSYLNNESPNINIKAADANSDGTIDLRDITKLTELILQSKK